LDLTNAENELFGTSTTKAQHFTQYGLKNSTVSSTLADASLIKMMNPLYYIGTKGTTTSSYWRIRQGTVDNDTSLAVSTLLSAKLENSGFNVDFSMPWDQSHGGDYDLDELFEWTDDIVASSKASPSSNGKKIANTSNNGKGSNVSKNAKNS
jgi:hypothetical protein